MADAPMTVVETERFLKDMEPLMSESEREEFVAFMGANPEAGKVMPETGGVRKIRWALRGRGKRSGARVTTICRCSCSPPIRRMRRLILAKRSATR